MLGKTLSKIERQKNNRIYGNAANQVLRSSSDDDANMRIFFEYFLLFYLIYVFSLIIRLVFSIYTKACYQCIVRRNVFENKPTNEPVNERQQVILSAMKQNPAITREDLANRLDVSLTTLNGKQENC